MIRAALAAAGVPTVVNGAGSVFDTAAAQDWLALLEAIEQPAATTRVRSAAMTAFFGWRAEDVATSDDAAWDRVHGRLHEWRRLLLRRGVAAMFEHVTAAEQLPARLLATLGGERTLTDLRHVAELLHEHGTTHDTAPSTLVAAAGTHPPRRARGGCRGPESPARDRCPGRAGVDDPPQQGPAVPHRLRPVPVAGRVDPR